MLYPFSAAARRGSFVRGGSHARQAAALNRDTTRIVSIVFIALLFTLPALADEPPTGRFQTRLDAREPLGLWPEMAKRFGWRTNRLDEPYKIEDESFEVYVPKPVAGKEYGMLVWINSDPGGAPPEAFLPVLDKHHLIWIGPNNAGNEVPMGRRFALAIDAAGGMKRRYAVDEERVYVAGLSGGGRAASMVAPMYPDLFRGGLYIVGVNYWKDLPVAADPESVWTAQFREPPAEMLKLAKSRSRFVLLTGEKDFNRDQTKATWIEGYGKDGFERLTYLEVPGMEHAVPPTEWFEKAVEALEKR